MEMPLISVIVPVYKVEQYLDCCVRSIVEQTYSNLEIILVDDGSPDNCGAMCDAWTGKDSRIKVIHKENGGLSDARNAGLAIASGELIGFVDSDDWIAPDMYRLLYEDMERNGSDISACGVQMVWEDGTPPRMLTPSGICVMDRESAMREIIWESAFKQPVWYKLYKAETVRDIQFPVGKHHEDVFWSYRAFGRANRVSAFDVPCYYYRQRSGSIMGNGFSMKRLDGLEAKAQRQEYIDAHFPALSADARWDMFFLSMYLMQNVLLHLERAEKEQAKRIIRETFRGNKPRAAQLKVLPLKKRIWGVAGLVSFEGLCYLRNLLGRGGVNGEKDNYFGHYSGV